jgi:phosphate transport system ATP-binding protein
VSKQIDIKDLDIYYGDFLAVEGVNLSVKANSVMSFIGPSGCGKSTVLRSINRMHEVIPGAYTTGEILLDGEDIYGPNVDPVLVRRTIGMVFQRPNPFPTMSIYENVIAGLKLEKDKKRKQSMDEVVEASLRGANLWEEVKDRLNRPGAGLSGGQQQRLCIARAIAVEPQVLLMDEPCSALDPISTHNMQQASRVSDNTAFFNLAGIGQPGHLIETGPTQEIFTRPTNQQTEDYVSGRFG